MRIAHALGWYFPESLGGTEVYVAALAERLRDAGHDVAVVAPDAGHDRVRRYDHLGVSVFRYPVTPSPSRAEAQSTRPARGAAALRGWLDEWRPDVFHLHSFVTGLGVHELEAARQAGARTVVTHHLPCFGYVCGRGTLARWGAVACDGIAATRKCAACLFQAGGVPRPIATLTAALTPLPVSRTLGALPGRVGTAAGVPVSIVAAGRLQARLNAAADVQVVLNDTGRRILVANGAPADRVHVNRLGLARPVAAGPRATGVPVRFGFMGRIHPAKGALELVRAARSIRPGVSFALEIRGIVQHGADRVLLDRIRSVAAGDPRITVAEPVPHERVAAVLAGFDVLCCPSAGFENGPTVALEAMAVGTPVLGTRIGNLAELVEDGVTGRLVDLGRPSALAGAIAEVAARPELVDRWRRRLPPARTMDEIAAEYERLYDRIGGPAPRIPAPGRSERLVATP